MWNVFSARIGGNLRKKRDSDRRWFLSSDPPDAFTRVHAFRGESQQVWHLSVFKSKQLNDRWPNIPEMTPHPGTILLRPNCELGRAESTVMDIDHPEEFFEAWQLWRFSQGSINCIDRTVRRCFLHWHLVRWDAPPGHDCGLTDIFSPTPVLSITCDSWTSSKFAWPLNFLSEGVWLVS